MMFKSKINSLLQTITNNLTSKTNWWCFLAGLSLVFAYAPFSQWWLVFLILPFCLNSIRDNTVALAIKKSFLFALGWFASGISWVHVSIDQFGGLPLVVSILLMLILSSYLALYPALACWLSSRFSSNKRLSLWLLPPMWLICEVLRAWVFTGFPWLSIGYSQIDGPLASFAPLIGEVGISVLLLSLCIAIADIISGHYRKLHLVFIVSALISGLLLTTATWVQPTEKTIKAALVQGNIQQSMKWQPEQEWPTMLKYLDLTRLNYDADIIIWPESAITALEPAAQNFLTMADKSAALNQSAIITGIINYNFESKAYFNSLIVLGKDNNDSSNGSYFYNHANRYYKNHLLPIGEFVPFGDVLRKVAPLFNLQYSSFSRGDYVQNNLQANNITLLPLICFEIAFPQQLAANMTKQTDIILTVSNDSWFGNSHGPHQHLEIARMRALEFGRPVLRATNNGVTAIINHQGQIQKKLPQFEEAVLKDHVQLVTGTTPYHQYGQFIHWFLLLLLLFIYFTLGKLKIKQ